MTCVVTTGYIHVKNRILFSFYIQISTHSALKTYALSPQSMKFLVEKSSKTLVRVIMFLDMNLEAQQVKAKITQWDYTKLETYCIDQEATHCKGIA